MLSRRGLAELTDRLGVSRLLLGRTTRPWLTIVNYHRVEELGAPAVTEFDDDIVDVTPEAFERQLDVMKRYLNFVSLADLRAAVDGAPLPRNPAMVTFDDGYLSCHDVALPALRRHGIRAVFFVTTEAVTSRRVFWWDRIAWTLKNARRRVIQMSYPFPVRIDLEAGLRAAS